MDAPVHALRPRRRVVAAAVLAVVVAVLAACATATPATRRTEDGTLRAALSFDPGSLDPDVFYGNEALTITTACYEGLLRYRPGSTEIEPALATGYDVSPDGRRLTFHLRRGVRFSDGSPLTAGDMRASIERRRAVDAGPAYMVAPVVATAAPDPSTLIVDLRSPIDPFLSWLASPYGLKAVNPRVVAQHTVNGDAGQGWLGRHCAGTGPYDLTAVTPGQRWQLTANPSWWGPPVSFRRVDFDLVPSFATQALRLRSGDLDIMTHGLTKADLDGLAGDPGFTTSRLPAISAVNLWINPHRPALASPDVRRAVGLALDRAALVGQVYGTDDAEVYNGVFAPRTLSRDHDYDLPFAPDRARAILAAVPPDRRAVTLQFTSDDSTNQQLAGLIAQQLGDVGFTVEQRGLPETEVLAFADIADSSRKPDLLVLPQNPDDASPSSFAQLQWLSGDDPGFFPPFDPAADQVLARAVTSADPATATRLYGQAADMYRGTYAFVPIANTRAVVVTRAGITGVEVERQGLWTVVLAALRSEPVPGR